jgi:hypothetical protein
MPNQIEITYRARDGRPAVDLDLHLGPDEQTEVFVGTSTSIPLARLSRIGTFAGKAPSVEMGEIRAYLDEHDLLTRAGSIGQRSPEMPGRFLDLRVDGREAQITISDTSDAEIDGFERLLHQLALAMTEQPNRAVAATLELHEQDGQIVPTVELRSIGNEPMIALLADPDQSVFTLYVQVELRGTKTTRKGVSFPVIVGTVAFSPDTVQAMAERGELPSGIAELPPDASYRFDLPAIARPDDVNSVTATGSLDFWLPDGLARRALDLLTPEVPLP